MKNFRKTAGTLILLAVIFVFTGIANAGYEFDDRKGDAYTAQWMAINQTGGTFGGDFDEAIQISTDISTANDDFSVIKVLNGRSDDEIDDRELHILFLLLVGGRGEFFIDMKAEESDFDISTPSPLLSIRGDTVYTNSLLKYGPVPGNPTWLRFVHALDRAHRETYDTVVQEILFAQEPNASPSQSVPRPLVISNVANAEQTAADVPLIVRMILKDGATKDANIIAADVVEWDMTGDKEVGGNKLVFVPIDDESLLTDNRKVNLYLTTEVVNHTSVRYAATTYDSYGDFEYPSYWKFDLARDQGTTYVDREFQLARKAHIAPGLVTVFKRKYDVNEENKRPLMLYPVGDTVVGTRSLRLNHQIIFGQRLGDTYKQKSTNGGDFNLFEVTAFKHRPAGDSFYENVKEITKAKGSVNIPTTSTFGQNSIKRDESMPSTVLQHFTIDQAIPANLRTNDGEGLLPVHITFNIPVSKISDRNWLNQMISLWNSGKEIEDLFFEKYQISLLTETNSQANPWNLSQELDRLGQYNKQIHVFFNDSTGKSTRDNDKGLITVSFIAMLMDGTRDGVRPELSVVEDHSITNDNDYIVIRDGINDNRWKMTFLVAPAGYNDNPTNSATQQQGENGGTLSSSGSGSGCNFGLGILGVLSLFAFLKRERS